jgi:BirA family transcriptional regulator, biotin operon repressor / biotin---[acetyl-CoA-carboxylase] ligase
VTGYHLGSKAAEAGYRLTAFESVGSTNTEAATAFETGDSGMHWFCALQQTAGRGRRGRQWETPHGNMAASLLLTPDVEPGHLATLGFVAGVALGQALELVLPSLGTHIGIDGADDDKGRRIALKWPNDILADGEKLAGILLELRKRADGHQAVVLGFGVNIVSAPSGLPYPATSFAKLGASVAAPDLFEALSDAFVEVFTVWNGGRGLSSVLELWRRSAAGIGAPVAVQGADGVVRGTFETIDETGRLVIRADTGETVRITTGDVHFGATATVRG